jgi:hypothetical protein
MYGSNEVASQEALSLRILQMIYESTEHQVFYLCSVHELLRKLSVNEASAALIYLSGFHTLTAIGGIYRNMCPQKSKLEEKDLKICDNGTLIQMWTSSCFYLKNFWRLDSVSRLEVKPIYLGPVDRASPYLRTPNTR